MYGFPACRAWKSVQASMSRSLNSRRNSQLVAFRTWSGRNVYQAMRSPRAKCSDRVNGFGSLPCMTESVPDTAARVGVPGAGRLHAFIDHTEAKGSR